MLSFFSSYKGFKLLGSLFVLLIGLCWSLYCLWLVVKDVGEEGEEVGEEVGDSSAFTSMANSSS